MVGNKILNKINLKLNVETTTEDTHIITMWNKFPLQSKLFLLIPAKFYI